MAKVSGLHLLLAFVIVFSGSSIILWATLPDDGYCRACGPLIEVRPLSTFYLFSPENMPDYRYYGPEIKYSKGEWIIPEDYLSGVNSGYKITDKDSFISLEADKPHYTPDVKAEGERLYFDILLFNNAEYSFSDVAFDVLFDVTIKKNIDGAYGEYSRFESDLWKETITAENIYEKSSQELRIYAPLLPVKYPESLYVDVYIVYPEKLRTIDGKELVSDNGEYTLPDSIPDVYDASDSDSVRKKRIYGYYIENEA